MRISQLAIDMYHPGFTTSPLRILIWQEQERLCARSVCNSYF